MTRRFLLLLTTALALAGCARGATKEDVMSGTATTAVYATLRCTEPNVDGQRCDRKTCKKDTHSDCATFKDRCTQTGHRYEGDNDSGACIRGDQTG